MAGIRRRVFTGVSACAAQLGMTSAAMRVRKGHLILMYHRTPEHRHECGDDPFAVAAEDLDRHLAFIKQHCRVLTLDEAVRGLCAKSNTRPLGVALTFDDGYRDNFEVALPLLAKHGLPATFFVVSGFCATMPDTFMSWDDLRDAVATGLISVGAHTHHHIALSRLAPSDVRAEIQCSKDTIEQALQLPVSYLAYPYGAYNPMVKQIAQEAGLAGALKDRGPATYTDSYELPRASVDVRNRSLASLAVTLAMGGRVI